MDITLPMQANSQMLQEVIELARAPQQFLSLYLPVDPAEVVSDSMRLRLTALLEKSAREWVDTPQNKIFQDLRQQIESFAFGLKPEGYGLAILASPEANVWQALWLPGPVEEHVHLGRGAYVLPLMDILEQWEPVALVRVARDEARLLVFATGQLEEERHIESDYPGRGPGRHGGETGPRYRPGSALPSESIGGAAARMERHVLVHVENHLKQVIHELEELRQQYQFRRFFIAGATESVTLFKDQLSRELADRLGGELSIEGRAQFGEIRQKLLEANQKLKQEEEQELVSEIITRAEKQQGAVTELAPTLWALNRRELHLLVLSNANHQQGGYCPTCQILLPPEDVACPQCDGKPVAVDLWAELPGFVQERAVQLRVVHGEAASQLWQYDGLGGVLEPWVSR